MLTVSDIEQLEQVDETLIRKILEVGQGCPKKMLYLEMGCTPMRFTIMMRRKMFFQYLVHLYTCIMLYLSEINDDDDEYKSQGKRFNCLE